MELIEGIDTMVIRVADIERATRWYEAQLGLKAIWQDDAALLVVLQTGALGSLTLWETAEEIKPAAETAAFPIFKTRNAPGAYQVLKDRGVVVGPLVEEATLRYFRVYDPDGNILEFCEVHS
ncbi:VOC family protein [Niabella sp.]|uniref:VOC family protein n=1 Tax=Niabella sp. TaxID=1962976 RepID=UPI00260764AE|nr:VOC family protein [Niabella sp.]